MSASFWVMKVLGPAALATDRRYAKLVLSGDLAVVTDELCEPIVEFDDQEPAMIRATIEHERTGAVHKVVLSADLPAILST